ncbi:MAG: penicillin-binding protein activator LpoB [Bacteroidales bacterium]
MKKIFKLSIVIFVIAITACTPTREVKRVSPDQQFDLSGRWNDSDAKMTADAMIAQVLSEGWLSEFQKQFEGKRPILIVGLVNNKTSEHISAETFIKDIEKAFLTDRRIRLVQAGDKREQLRGERADQQEYASAETTKKWGKELGADFIMQGSINSTVDSFNKDKVVSYKINLELTNIETNEIVWIGDKEIKKVISD